MADHDDREQRRKHARHQASIRVDCTDGESFLFAYIENISEMGIFVRSDTPAPVSTALDLHFEHAGVELKLRGEVAWINPLRPDGDDINPGMGIHFIELTSEQREKLVQLVRTIAYIASSEEPSSPREA